VVLLSLVAYLFANLNQTDVDLKAGSPAANLPALALLLYCHH